MRPRWLHAPCRTVVWQTCRRRLQEVQHGERCGHVVAVGKACCDVVFSSRSAGIDCVDVEGEDILDIGRNNRTRDPLQVFQRVADPRDVLEIPQGAGPVLVRIDIEHPHGGTARAEVHGAVARLEIKLWRSPMYHLAFGRFVQKILDQCAVKQQPPAWLQSYCRTDWPTKSSVHRLLSILLEERQLAFDPERQTYQPGPRLLT